MLLNMKKMTKTMKKMTNFAPMYAPTCVPKIFSKNRESGKSTYK